LPHISSPTTVIHMASPCRFLLAMLLACAGGCAEMLANKIVTAPNLHRPERGTDAPDTILEASHVSRQLRIPVGPPGASLAVWIINPHQLSGKLYRIDSDGRLHIEPDPAATQPTTLSATPRGTVFILHGIWRGKESPEIQLLGLLLASKGFRCVLVDLRGHGRSTGDQITYGAVETHDMVQVLDRLEQEGLIAGNVGVLGGSLGGAVAINWAAIDPRVNAVVALETFSSLREAAVDFAPLVLRGWQWLFSPRAIQRCVDVAGRIAHFDPDESSPIKAIASSKQWVLLIHGEADTWLTPENSRRLLEAGKGHAHLVTLPNIDHVGLWTDPSAVSTIVNLAAKWFDGSGPPATRPASEPAGHQP
jgi:pimeloyl-ACP methyl ester carboxylesterase